MMTQRRPTVRIKAFSLMLRFLFDSRPLDDFICKFACAPIRRRRREPKPRESPAAKLVLPKVPSVRKTPSSSSGERWEEIGIPLCNIHRGKNSPAILWWKESKLSTFTGLYGINTASYIPELLNAISRWNFWAVLELHSWYLWRILHTNPAIIFFCNYPSKFENQRQCWKLK